LAELIVGVGNIGRQSNIMLSEADSCLKLCEYCSHNLKLYVVVILGGVVHGYMHDAFVTKI
jgi:hypothetical protein